MPAEKDVANRDKAIRWVDLPKLSQIPGYWKAIPNDETTWLDGGDFEIVYVYFDGKWSVMRLGESTRERLEDFLWIGPVTVTREAKATANGPDVQGTDLASGFAELRIRTSDQILMADTGRANDRKSLEKS